MVSEKGQFFSPDLLIAILIFIFGIFMFSGVTIFVFAQIDEFSFKTNIDEIANASLNNLIKSSGVPSNWEEKEINEIRFFGISDGLNVINERKLLSLINFLDNNYLLAKEKLGFGKLDFKLRLINSDGFIVYESNKEIVTTNVFSYSRIVYLNEELFILEGVVLSE